MSLDVSRGLDKVSDLPVRSGYLELGGEWTPRLGLRGYGEIGYRPESWLSAFARGEIGPNGSRIFGGLRATF